MTGSGLIATSPKNENKHAIRMKKIEQLPQEEQIHTADPVYLRQLPLGIQCQLNDKTSPICSTRMSDLR